MNKKPKYGRGGRRNRQRRAALARRTLNKANLNTVAQIYVVQAHVEPPAIEMALLPSVNLSDLWNEEVAKTAFDLWIKSGKTQKEFAAENNFPVSRFRSWKTKIAS